MGIAEDRGRVAGVGSTAAGDGLISPLFVATSPTKIHKVILCPGPPFF